MPRPRPLVLVAPAWLLLTGHSPGAQPDFPGDAPSAQRARAALARVCYECHASTAHEPRGDIDYMDDPDRLVREGLVIPGKPEESELLIEITSGKMPPRRWRQAPGHTPPSEQEIAEIRAWIAGVSGVDAAPPPSASPAPPPPAQPAPAQPGGSPGPVRPTALQLIARGHLVLLHFPIALSVLAGGLEGWRLLRPRSGVGAARDISAVIAGLTGALVAALGWLLAWTEQTHDPYLDLHRWLGTGGAALAMLTMIAVMRSRLHVNVWGRERPSRVRTALLLLTPIGIGAAAHFGGMMVWGPGFFGL